MIPKQLRPYRFVRLGGWNEWKNKKTKEVKIFPKEYYEQLINEKEWTPLGKAPFDNAWQHNGLGLDEINCVGGNYGVLNGVLRGLDDDTEDKILIKLFHENFGETFRVRDHLYFEFTNQDEKKIIFYDKNGKHCGELQGKGQQCVGPGSIHPSGKTYNVEKDIEIVKIDYDKFCEVFKDYMPNKTKQVVREFKKTTWTGDSITDIPLTNIISLAGLADMGNGCYQGPHPSHGSVNGMNFRVNTIDNSWFCYRCWTGGGPSELIGVMENIISCSQAGSKCYTSEQGKQVIETAREKYGLKKPESQSNFKPMGWAQSINIKRLAERKGWLMCSICNSDYQFNEKLGWFKCSCSRGGIKKFVESHLIKAVNKK